MSWTLGGLSPLSLEQGPPGAYRSHDLGVCRSVQGLPSGRGAQGGQEGKRGGLGTHSLSLSRVPSTAQPTANFTTGWGLTLFT